MGKKFMVYKLGTENQNRSVPYVWCSCIITEYFDLARSLMMRYGPTHAVAEYNERLGGFYPLTNFQIELGL